MIEVIKIQIRGDIVYKPEGDTEAIITGLFWDTERGRPAVSVIYNNGAADWIPISDIHGLGGSVGGGYAYRVSNGGKK